MENVASKVYKYRSLTVAKFDFHDGRFFGKLPLRGGWKKVWFFRVTRKFTKTSIFQPKDPPKMVIFDQKAFPGLPCFIRKGGTPSLTFLTKFYTFLQNFHDFSRFLTSKTCFLTLFWWFFWHKNGMFFDIYFDRFSW